MKVGLLLLSLVSINAYSLDCGGLKEGEVVRIDKGQGSLAKAAVQDQDGVGSCYANQASLMLQSILPDRPNLSYLNFALYYTQDKSLPQARGAGSSSYIKDDGTRQNSAVYGGFACESITAAMERQRATGKGSICKSDDVNLEHAFFDNGKYQDLQHGQEKTLLQASVYMDSYQQKFGYAFDKNNTKNLQQRREEADKFSTALRNFVKNSSGSYLSDICAKPDTQKGISVVQNTFAQTYVENDCNLAKGKSSPICKSFEQLGSFKGIPKSNQVEFILNPVAKTTVEKALPGLYKTSKGLEGFQSGLFTAAFQYDFKTSPAQKAAFVKSISSNIPLQDLAELDKEYRRVALKQFDDCKERNMLAFFKDKIEFLSRAKQDTVLCNYTSLLEKAANLAEVLPEKAFTNATSFIDFISMKAGLNYDEAMLSLIAKDCAPNKRVMLPENLKCEKNGLGFTAADYAEDEKYGKVQRVIKDQRKKIFASLQKNIGVGLDICTKFWNEPNFDFNKQNASTRDAECASTGKHGLHAITMIGYRCKDNKMQYLSQNSWGTQWKLDNNAYEIEEGKIWIDEDKLFKNTRDISYLSL